MLDIFDEVEKIDGLMIYDVLQAVLARYKVLFPNWEIRTVAIRTDMDIEQQYEDILRLLKSARESIIEAEKLPTYDGECGRARNHAHFRIVRK